VAGSRFAQRFYIESSRNLQPACSLKGGERPIRHETTHLDWSSVKFNRDVEHLTPTKRAAPDSFGFGGLFFFFFLMSDLS